MLKSKEILTAVIVTYKSAKVIHNCIKSISNQVKIIIVDNSNDKKFKADIEKKYQNVKCILSSKNLGMGTGNNLGLKYVKTDYAIILNPDVILQKKTLEELISYTKIIKDFSVMAPISKNKEYPNYKLDTKIGQNFSSKKPFKVKSVDGFAMLLNLKRLNKMKLFKNHQYFDENFFMYLENDDLCKRLVDLDENIYVIPRSKIYHLGGKGVDKKFINQIELSRNWHWNWSKFYFNKKHYGFYSAIKNCYLSFISALIKYFFYLIILNKRKKIYKKRVSGYLNAFLDKPSWYRPEID